MLYSANSHKQVFTWIYRMFWGIYLTPSNAEATFLQSTRMQRFSKKKHVNAVMLVFIR